MIRASTSSGTVPVQYLLHSIAPGIERAGAEQPQLPPLQRDGREDEARRHRGEHEAGQPEVQERDHDHQAERDPLARVDRQRLDVEDVDQQQHGEQDELAPLGVVAEEQPQVLDDELALGRRHAPEQRPRAGRAAAGAPSARRLPAPWRSRSGRAAGAPARRRSPPASAGPHSSTIGHGSATRSSQFMTISAVHSLGSSGLVGVRSSAR